MMTIWMICWKRIEGTGGEEMEGMGSRDERENG
jgi:hypothetical protein